MYMTIYTSKIKKKILNKFHILVRFAYTSKFMTQTTLSELSVMRVFWFWVYIFVFFCVILLGLLHDLIEKLYKYFTRMQHTRKRNVRITV